MTFDRNYLPHAPVVLRSVRANTRADIRLVLLTRGLSAADLAPVVAAARPSDVRHFAMDGRLDGVPIAFSPGLTVSGLDHLFLPDLLPEVDRAVYLDVDLVVRGDLAELAAFEPSARGVAARPAPTATWATLDRAFERKALEVGRDRAARLRSLAAAATDLTAPYFNAGVLVLSLQRMRARNFVAKATRAIREFGFRDQDALNLICGGDFAPLPWYWNANPSVEFVDEAKIVHWTGANKPWRDAPVLAKTYWTRFARPHGQDYGPATTEGDVSRSAPGPSLARMIDGVA
jgi:lipopolysaccharide biosynthesis glycosyltransferase